MQYKRSWSSPLLIFVSKPGPQEVVLGQRVLDSFLSRNASSNICQRVLDSLLSRNASSNICQRVLDSLLSRNASSNICQRILDSLLSRIFQRIYLCA
ncbi:uncharacterized protein CCOS01_17082 [Colletotrichum costaricense]|uniref:Uncharacterized protein n=1 Tax=Colletotrichum costaricense TaxID=1209916 RepID=A0AAJ0DRP9_9PEZI|nr:uncharacterized protein CCOS01_17082 [Colletotrichum costaricense]KAK1503143.1 hypothetical protein CCOS01_17082 [Colletotrichum costaricense]